MNISSNRSCTLFRGLRRRPTLCTCSATVCVLHTRHCSQTYVIVCVCLCLEASGHPAYHFIQLYDRLHIHLGPKCTQRSTTGTMPARRGDTCLTKLGWVLLSILLPPLAVLLNVGRCNKDVVINILLTILAWLPGKDHMWGMQECT